ncbi:hypothetical protein [Olleya marilimosa]|uniref:hypothetical protein n=1 Tax=Olleya marilimosa TaxID=272164 RepID=UPI00048825B2|nr:hypothetical protein [Olleya marilimosa]
MKRNLIFVIAFFATFSIFGQEKQDFKLNFGIQWNMPERYFNSDLNKFNGENSGLGLHIYPKWYFKENISLGLNMEYAIVEEKATTDAISSFDIFSFSPTINYYFLKSKIRPYIGVGIGIYTVSRAEKKINTGIRPIIGMSVFNRFDLSFEYSKIFGDLEINPLVSEGFGNYYVSLKGSYSISLSRKKTNPNTVYN